MRGEATTSASLRATSEGPWRARSGELRPWSAALLALCACTPGAYRSDAMPADPTPRAAPVAREEVVVVLAAAEQAQQVTIGGASGGDLTFRRQGRLVTDSRGAAARSIEVGPASQRRGSQRSGLTLGGRRYAGTLTVEVHPVRGLRVTNRVPLEQYVEGVVAAEIVLWWAHPAEIEAQAIATRSYALHTASKRARTEGRAYLWDGVADQAYRGLPGLSEGSAQRSVRSRLEDALARSRGLVLVLDEDPLDARFHAACGGHTTDPRSVFPVSVGWPGVRCAPCAARAAREEGGGPDAGGERPLGWSFTASASDLDGLARRAGVGAPIASLRPARRDDGGRWISVEVTGASATRTIPADDLRGALGGERLKSVMVVGTWPHAGSPVTAGLNFRGVGRGHGVGLCQEGSHDYAGRGWSARRILQHYYPGARIERLSVQ